MNPEQIAATTLEKMKSAGFDDAQVTMSITRQDELNMANNEASLLRSTEDYDLSIIGIIDGRKASTALTDLTDRSIEHSIADLFEQAGMAPQDEANAVSSGETGHFEQGPQTCNLDLLVTRVEELLEFRARETPRMSIDEGAALHVLTEEYLLTSAGTSLSSRTGCYGLSAFGTATDGDRSSSFNYAGGSTNDLDASHAADFFGIGEMLRETERQIHTRPLDGSFVGDVILAPGAVADLLGWLLGQVSDMALISDASMYRNRTGERIASPLLTIRSRFDGPGLAPVTSDGFIAPAFDLVFEGRLETLTPGYYASRKTGIPHRPCASGWSIDPGHTSREELVASVPRGALVNRLSMGSPGANGDFSGVIKNSFLIEDGKAGTALAETMISGNMARMLEDINGISTEHLDTGSEDLPWIRIPGLHFS